MSTKRLRFLDEIGQLSAALSSVGGVLSGEAAAHVHLAAATGSTPGEPPRYAALPPSRTEAIFPPGCPPVGGVEADRGVVADVIRDRLDFWSSVIVLADGTRVPALTREAVLAQLLASGFLAIGLAGSVVRLANKPPIDVDDVREILKAARRGELFQPMLELMDVA